jgi:2-haloacid dehalogenase
MRRPKVLAFDLTGTLFSLERLEWAGERIGLSPNRFRLWLAQTVRDGIALTCAGAYRPFREVAAGRLAVLLAQYDIESADGTIDGMLDHLSDLMVYPDAVDSLHAFYHAGFRLITVGNFEAEVTGGLLERAGLSDLIDQIVSIDEVGRWKPHPSAYRLALNAAECEPDDMAMVSAYDWDLAGAAQAGLATCWVNRLQTEVSKALVKPDIAGTSLREIERKLLDMPLIEAA